MFWWPTLSGNGSGFVTSHLAMSQPPPFCQTQFCLWRHNSVTMEFYVWREIYLVLTQRWLNCEYEITFGQTNASNWKAKLTQSYRNRHFKPNLSQLHFSKRVDRNNHLLKLLLFFFDEKKSNQVAISFGK